MAGKRFAKRLVLFQTTASLILAVGVLLTLGHTHALSALCGGVIAALANGFYAARVFAPYRAQQPERMVAGFYAAELAKIVLTGLLFAGTFVLIRPLSAGALFAAYLLIQMAPVLAARYLE